MKASLKTLTSVFLLGGLLTAGAQLFNDFEGGTVGSAYGFRHPSFSGSTAASIATDPASTMTVVAGYDSNPTQVGQFSWNFVDAATTRWVRLTTSGAAGFPNPLLDLNQILQFDIFSASEIKVAVGVRETGGVGPVGANGGSSGTIEWVGAEQASANIGIPPGGTLITAGSWQTVSFDFRGDPTFAFTGNGTLTGDWGVMESLAISSLGSASQLVYVDNFRIVPVPEPSVVGLLGLAGVLLAGRWFRRRH